MATTKLNEDQSSCQWLRRIAVLALLGGGISVSISAGALETESAPVLDNAPAEKSEVATVPSVKVRNQTRVAEMPQGVLQLDQTVISGNQELPKVLYILPWREPQGLPDIEIQAEFSEAEVFKRLYPPAYRRELGYFKTLEGITRQDQEG